jgi:hypothetical protein
MCKQFERAGRGKWVKSREQLALKRGLDKEEQVDHCRRVMEEWIAEVRGE